MANTPDARSSNGTPLFKNNCPGCGAVRLSDARRLGNKCRACSPKDRVTHGLSGTRLYRLLCNIRARCEYPSASNYAYYGGRGIAVCDEWRSNPQAFVDWALANGYQPGLELDRRDNDGPYAPWNCQFLVHAPNSRKRSNARCNAETAAAIRAELAAGAKVADAARKLAVPYMVAYHISKGTTWNPDQR